MAEITRRGPRKWLVRVFLGRDPKTGKVRYQNQTVTGGKREAQAVASELESQRSKGLLTAESATIGELLDDLIRDYRLNRKDVAWCETLCNVHLRRFFGKIGANKLTTSDVNAYIDARRELGRKNATINNELALLRRALSLGKEADPPKVTRVPKIPKLKTDNVRKGFFEHTQYQAMRSELPEELRPVLTFAYFTGCRRGEILGLRWSQVDLDACMIRLEAGETKHGCYRSTANCWRRSACSATSGTPCTRRRPGCSSAMRVAARSVNSRRHGPALRGGPDWWMSAANPRSCSTTSAEPASET
jgi:integrase